MSFLAVILAGTMITAIGFMTGFIPMSNTTYQPNAIITINQTIAQDFAEFHPNEINFMVNSPSYTVSPGLTNVRNLHQYSGLVESERSLIEENGFVCRQQSEYAQIYEILEENKDEGIPSFVSSDSVLHGFHVLYDMALRTIEMESFWHLLKNLTYSQLNESYRQYTSFSEENRWKSAALRNVMFFAVTSKLFDDNVTIPSEAINAVDHVLELIEEHSDITDNWFQEYAEDFTQYLPRGHYTRNENLKKYFKVMMWYGRVLFRLVPEGDLDHNDRGMNETAQALLMVKALQEDIPTIPNTQSGFEIWDSIFQPTAFFVGSSDALTPHEYYLLMQEIYGPDVSLESLVNETLLDEFIRTALTMREPLILSPVSNSENNNQTMGLSFMGQRYTPDSYFLGQLVYDNVGTEGQARLLPKGLDVMSVLGSDRAWELLDDQLFYLNYLEQMNFLRNITEAITPREWTNNLYYLWMYSLLPLLTSSGEGYPYFMNNAAWTDKQLMTALASWTELKHDTVLYSAQSATPIVPSETQTVIGYVEPVPRLYARLASLCEMMINGLEERLLLNNELQDRLSQMKDFLGTLQLISVKELNGTSLTENEIKTIERSGAILKGLSTFTNSTLVAETDSRMAIITDVHTDYNTGVVLEEAVGNPMIIHVAINIDGLVILTRGGVFSYYEFTQPMENRLTDEDWQGYLESGLEPDMPAWTSSFTVPPVDGVVQSLVLSQNSEKKRKPLL